MEQMLEVPLFSRYARQALTQHAQLAQPPQQRRWLYESIRLMLSDMVYDVLKTTQAQLAESRPASVVEVRAATPLVLFSPGMRAETRELKKFLFDHLYRHDQVMDTMNRAKQVVRDLFDAYLETPAEMRQDSEPAGDITLQRRVSDHIAGMTDRFALREHARLTGKTLFHV
jgi:dGTPase